MCVAKDKKQYDLFLDIFSVQTTFKTKKSSNLRGVEILEDTQMKQKPQLKNLQMLKEVKMQLKESSKLTDIQKKQKSNLGKFKTSLSPKFLLL